MVALVSTATETLKRCGLVVIRNALDRGFMQKFRGPFTDYTRGLTNGSINTQGRTTHNERFFLHMLSSRRWELLLPRSFASHELLGDEALTAILSHFRVLGAEYALHSLGAAISEPGAVKLHWHRDSAYPYAMTGAAGTDMPPHAVTLLTPLHDVTPEHGRTEFCLASHHLMGLERPFVKVEDPELEPLLEDEVCPKGMKRVMPQLNLGDLILFDYNTMHRAGSNTSPQLRSLLYLTFSRPWYKDTGNFDNDQTYVSELGGQASPIGSAPVASAVGTPLEALPEQAREELERLTYRARFAEPYAAVPEEHASPAVEVLEDMLNVFAPLKARLEEEGYELDEDEPEDEDETDDDDDDDEEEEEGECTLAKDGQCETGRSMRCPMRTLFSTPIIR